MMMEYDFDTLVDRSGTLSSKWDAKPGLLPLWVADMDLPCADPILKALHQRVDRSIFGYTETLTKEYTDSVTGWMKRRFGWDADAQWIRYSAGVVQALSALIYLLSKPGDKILLQKPVYGPFMMAVESQDRVVCNSPLVLKGNRYEIDFDDLAEKFADPQVAGMLMCSPHNPAGRVWSTEELTRILSLAKANGKWIISDEIHSDIVREGITQTPLLKLAGDWTDHVYACTSVSKTFNLAGMQLSNIFIPNADTRARWDNYVRGTLHVGNANPLSITAMMAAYNESEDWLNAANAYIDANLEFLRTYLAQKLPKATMAVCEGTYLAWVDFTAYEPDTDKLNSLLTEDAKVALVPGEAFGAEEGRNYQRINVACPRFYVREGIDRIAAVLKKEGL